MAATNYPAYDLPQAMLAALAAVFPADTPGESVTDAFEFFGRAPHALSYCITPDLVPTDYDPSEEINGPVAQKQTWHWIVYVNLQFADDRAAGLQDVQTNIGLIQGALVGFEPDAYSDPMELDPMVPVFKFEQGQLWGVRLRHTRWTGEEPS